MSQDQSPTDKATDPKHGQEPGQQRGIDQPVDALRAGMPNNQTKTKTDIPNQAGAMNSKSDTKTEGKADSANGTKGTGDPASLNVPKKSGGVWTGLILGLVLVVVALGVGLWWQQQRFEAVAKEIATRLQQSDAQVAQASQRASDALSLATAQRDVVDQLSRELSVTSNELKTLQQAWEAANEGLDQTLLLNDLRRLIIMANQELVLFGNVNSAVSILSSVEAMLNTQSAPALKNLQQAVITDLARLRAVPQVDVSSLSARLDSLIQLTGKAPLLSPAGASVSQRTPAAPAASAASGNEPAAKSAQPATSADQPWWSAWLSWDQATGKLSQWTSEASSVLLSEFADVMSIRKADDPQALLLSEEQAIQLKANVRAMLLSAQLALMTRQADIWRSELTEVRSLLNTRYDNQALDTKASLSLLDELLDAPVAADVPQITETLSALATAERSLSIPAEKQAQQGQPESSETSSDATQASDSELGVSDATTDATATDTARQGN